MCCIGIQFDVQRTFSAHGAEIWKRVVSLCRVFLEGCHGTRAVCNRIDALEQTKFRVRAACIAGSSHVV